jgi:hypothetical protein
VNATETAKLCDIISSLCPAQRFDENTPAVWHAVLVDIRIEDALDAVKHLASRQPFIGASDICQQVKAIRRDRIERSGVDGLAFNSPEERRALIQAAGDGTLDEHLQAEGRAMLAAGTDDNPWDTPVIVGSSSVLRSVPRSYGKPAPLAKEPAPASVSTADAAAIEAERARQLKALEAIA